MTNEEFLFRTALSMGLDPTGQRVGTWESELKLKKNINFQRALSETALNHNVSVTSLESSSIGWFRESVRFSVEGQECDLCAFMKSVGSMLDNYKNKIDEINKPAQPAPRKWF